jgi:hypothetical protein
MESPITMDTIDIQSQQSFQMAVHAAVREALALRARRIVLLDEDYDPWALDDAALIDDLTSFVRLPGRTVLVIGRRFDGVARRCPRFVAWRRTWGHAVDVRRPVDDEARCPTLLLVDRMLSVELLDRVRWRGRVSQNDPRTMVLSDEIDAFAQRTEPTFGATTLGL